MLQTFEVNKTKLFNAYWVHNWTIIFILPLLSFVFYTKPNKVLIIASILFIIYYYLPCFYIYWEYYKYNKNYTFTIDKEEKWIKHLNKLGEEKQLLYDEIDKIVFYLSYPMYRRTFTGAIPHSDTYYAKIVPKAGNEDIIITALACKDDYDLEELFEGVKMEREARFFPVIAYDKA